MTKLEALKSTINFPLPDLIYTKALLDRDVDGSAEYTSLDTKDIDLCASGLLFALLTSPDIKEGDYSQTLPDRGQLLNFYSAICKKWNVPNLIISKPTIKGVSVW